MNATISAKYDIIVDAAGTAPYSRSHEALTADGRLVIVLGSLYDLFPHPFAKHRIIASPSSERPEDMRTLAKLAETGEYRAVVERTFPFEQIADAHRLVDSGHKRGDVAVLLA